MAKTIIKAPAKPAVTKAPVKAAAPAPNATLSKELAEASAPAIHQPSRTALIAHADEFATMESGFDNVGPRDVIIPRLTILQALSPQLQRNKPEFIQGAAAGMFCDTATGDVFEGPLELVPCFFKRVYLEWAPRNTGKGLVRNHETDDAILDRCSPDAKGRMITPDGNYVAETATYYVINLTSGGRRSFVPLSSTQMRAARRWMTQLTAERLTGSNGRSFTPPIFYRSWMATVSEQSNNEGSWFGWSFSPGRPIVEIDSSRGLLREAQSFYDTVREGEVAGDVGGEDYAQPNIEREDVDAGAM